MALKPKNKTPEPGLPPALVAHAKAALYHQVASQFHDSKFSDLKKTLSGIIERAEGIEAEVGKALKFGEGSITFKSRENAIVNTDVVLTAIKDGRITIESVLACVSKFATDSLKALVPQAVEEGTPTVYVAMQANADFKKLLVQRLETEDEMLTEIRSELGIVGEAAVKES